MTDHSLCNHAGKQVRCDRCGKAYICTPWQDFYCAAEGDHCCEPCLLAGVGVSEVHTVVIDEDGEVRDAQDS